MWLPSRRSAPSGVVRGEGTERRPNEALQQTTVDDGPALGGPIPTMTEIRATRRERKFEGGA